MVEGAPVGLRREWSIDGRIGLERAWRAAASSTSSTEGGRTWRMRDRPARANPLAQRALYAFSHVEWIRKRGGGTAGANASGSAQFRAQCAPSTRGSRGSGPVRSSGRPTGCSGHDCRARSRGRPLATPDRPVIQPTARSRERKSPGQREGSTRRKLPACWRDVDRSERRNLYAVEWLVRNSVPDLRERVCLNSRAIHVAGRPVVLASRLAGAP